MSGEFDLDDGVSEEGTLSEEPTPCAYTEYREGEGHAELPNTGAGSEGVEARVWDALSEVEDPEMPVSVVDLGLIYDVAIEEREETHATVTMTLTYTGCPARRMLTNEIREAAASADGVDSAEIRLVWSPEWSIDLVTERGRESLREFGLSV
ncbi:1,2-phenylacetyl-CoA epoxidase subunit PaaD [Natronorarus salvus]|uniref:1,2-phenylacetyl-CoA epoxidase subunit PaaD n=1 Tax=Natronorarus salvus TaxID=3117733 RepID=UPI002F26249D